MRDDFKPCTIPHSASEMTCELIPWQSYIAGAVLEPVDCTPFFDEMTCDEERRRLNAFYRPTGGRRKLKKIATFDKMALDSRALYFSETVDLLAIFGRPNIDLNINCPGMSFLPQEFPSEFD